MDVLVIHLLNALLYASVLFLIAGGLSLIYGVMRIVNMAHGNLYAFGAYVTAWAIGSVAAGGPTAPPLVVPPPGAAPPEPNTKHLKPKHAHKPFSCSLLKKK